MTALELYEEGETCVLPARLVKVMCARDPRCPATAARDPEPPSLTHSSNATPSPQGHTADTLTDTQKLHLEKPLPALSLHCSCLLSHPTPSSLPRAPEVPRLRGCGGMG